MDDGTVEEPARVFGDEVRRHRSAAGRLSKDRDQVGVASKVDDVGLDPLKGKALVLDAEVLDLSATVYRKRRISL